MNKYIVAAILGGVSTQECEFEAIDNMGDIEFLRKVTQAGYRGYIRGTYLESEDIISDDCLGDWMPEQYNKLVNQAQMAMADPLAVSLEDYTNWAAEVATLLFKNKDTCALAQITDDWRQWCMEDQMRCFFGKGIEDRVINNAVALVKTGI